MENKCKVLLCSPKTGSGGITQWTNHILNYYNSLSSCEVRMDLEPMDRKTYVSESMSTLRRIVKGCSEYAAILKSIRKRIQVKYDVVHVVSSASMGLFKDYLILKDLKRKNIKSVIHFRFGRIPDLYKGYNWERKMLDRVVRLADKVIVIDQKSYDTLVSNGYKHICYLPNPVSSAIAPLIEANKQIERKPRTILFAGHIVKTKGVLELIEACIQIPDIHLKMIGLSTPDMKQVVEELAQKKGDLSWFSMPGNLSFAEVIKEMLSCAVFVLPTYTEGFPNVILESMACGCPIVTTPVGAIPEMLDINGENNCGICVPVRDIDQLKVSIKKMLDNPSFAAACGHNAQQRVNAQYSMPVVWKQLTGIWKELAILT